MTETKTGRPSSYTNEQVLRGIELVEEAGEQPTGDTVKKMLCAHLDVSKGINAQSLNTVVIDLLQDRKRKHLEHLVILLPDTTKKAAAKIAGRFATELTNHMAEEYDHLRAAVGRKLVEKEEDICNQRTQIRSLQSRIEEKDANIADLELANIELRQQLETAKAEISELAGKVADLRKAEDLEMLVLTAVSRALETKVQPAA